MKKWFYAAQTDSENKLREEFPYMSCSFQIVTKDRVINQFHAHGTDIQVQIVKRGKNVSVFVYSLTTNSAYQFS